MYYSFTETTFEIKFVYSSVTTMDIIIFLINLFSNILPPDETLPEKSMQVLISSKNHFEYIKIRIPCEYLYFSLIRCYSTTY